MAYVFNQIQSALDDQPNKKLNVLSQGGNVVTAPEGSGSQATPSADPTAAAQAREQGKTRAASVAQTRTQTPGFVSQAAQNVSKAGAAVQNEADAYVQNAQGLNPYATANEEVQTATGPNANQDSYKKVSSLLGTSKAAAAPSFTPATNASVYHGEYGTNAGLQQALRNSANAVYSPGEAAFDAGALRSNAGFNQILATLDRQQDDVNGLADRLPGEATKQVQGLRDNQLKDSQKAVRGQLGDIRQGILDAEGESARGANQRIQDEQNDPSYVEQYIPDAYNRAYGQAGELKQYLPDPKNTEAVRTFINANPYLKFGQYDPSQFVNQDQANQFNQISTLLGDSQGQAAYQGKLPGDAAFDSEGYERAVLDAAGKRSRGESTIPPDYQPYNLPTNPDQRMYQPGGITFNPYEAQESQVDVAQFPSLQAQMDRTRGQPNVAGDPNTPANMRPPEARLKNTAGAEGQRFFTDAINGASAQPGLPTGIDAYEQLKKILNF